MSFLAAKYREELKDIMLIPAAAPPTADASLVYALYGDMIYHLRNL